MRPQHISVCLGFLGVGEEIGKVMSVRELCFLRRRLTVHPYHSIIGSIYHSWTSVSKR